MFGITLLLAKEAPAQRKPLAHTLGRQWRVGEALVLADFLHSRLTRALRAPQVLLCIPSRLAVADVVQRDSHRGRRWCEEDGAGERDQERHEHLAYLRGWLAHGSNHRLVECPSDAPRSDERVVELVHQDIYPTLPRWGIVLSCVCERGIQCACLGALCLGT